MTQPDTTECPMCGSLMGAEARPAAMRTAAEALDRLDRLERRLHEAERGAWSLTSLTMVCVPCQQTLSGGDLDREGAIADGLRARIEDLRAEHERARRGAA